MLGRQKTGSDKERVQVLYLLKSKQVGTVQAAAQLIGRNRSTVVPIEMCMTWCITE
ncbi:MAG: hypothetical protein ACK451_13565 [Pseudanabaena sp.]